MITVPKDRSTLYTALRAAQAAKQAAEQTVDDAYTALRLSGWGKIEEATWDFEYESDDQGGSYVSLNTARLMIAGELYEVGYNFEDLYDMDDLVEEGSALDLLMQKYELAGIHEEVEAFKHSLAELAEVTYEEFGQFLGLLNDLVEDNKEAGEISFI